jgi:Protein of unknown function (DUF3455)
MRNTVGRAIDWDGSVRLEMWMRNIALIIVTGILIGKSAFAAAADEDAVMPPPGSALLLELVAHGVQIYACEAKEGAFRWSFKAPEANLFDKQGQQIGTHFGGPTGSSMMLPLLSARSLQEPMRQSQTLFSGCCYAPKATTDRVTYLPPLISDEPRPRAE